MIHSMDCKDCRFHFVMSVANVAMAVGVVGTIRSLIPVIGLLFSFVGWTVHWLSCPYRLMKEQPDGTDDIS